MRAYLKILGITLSIQAVLFGLSKVAYRLDWGFVPEIALLFGGFILSAAAGVIAAVKWCRGTGHMLCCIFLMPTNYVLPVFLGFAVYKLNAFLDILESLPENFG